MNPACLTLAGLLVSTAIAHAAGRGTWTVIADPGPGRTLHTGTLLPDGRVMLAGGENLSSFSSVALSLVEYFNPSSNTFTKGAKLDVGREQHTATLLNNGLVLIAGGSSDTVRGTALSTAILYNPVTNSWSPTGNMHLARFGQQATLLHDGRVLLMGGTPDVSTQLTECEIYDPATGLWTVTGSLKIGRRYSSAITLPDGDVLEAGDGIPYGEVYSVKTGTWSQTETMASVPFGETLELLPNGTVLAPPSQGNAPAYNAVGLLYNPNTNMWTKTGSSIARNYAATATLRDGTVLVAGGCTKSCSVDEVSSAVRYAQSTGIFYALPAMHFGRDSAVAVSLPDGRVLVHGGFPGPGPEIYTP